MIWQSRGKQCCQNYGGILEKYIYKIENKVNSKVYIGQTNDYAKRFQTHKSLLRGNKHENVHLQGAWNKYGEDVFDFSVIDCGENYNDLEREYISTYQSTNPNYGYNVAEGGENPPVYRGEEHFNAKLSLDEVHTIKDMLIKQIDKDKIVQKFQLNSSTVNRINNGELWYEEDYSYPLGIYGELPQSLILLVISDLKNTKLYQKEIAKKYGISRTEVTAINNGSNQNTKIDGENYPIRLGRVSKK